MRARLTLVVYAVQDLVERIRGSVERMCDLSGSTDSPRHEPHRVPDDRQHRLALMQSRTALARRQVSRSPSFLAFAEAAADAEVAADAEAAADAEVAADAAPSITPSQDLTYEWILWLTTSPWPHRMCHQHRGCDVDARHAIA